jgi:cell division protein FtsQ
MNPRVKKILRNILFLLSIPLIIGAFVFASTISQNQIYKGLKVVMKNPAISFVTQDDVISMLEDNGLTKQKTFEKKVKVKQIEQQLETNKWISDAVVFSSANGILNINITQKEPVVRIQQKDSNDYSYYLDQYANPIDWSESYTPRVLVATCPRMTYSKADLELKSNLVRVSDLIKKDTFWNAFVTQIDVDANREFNIIPALGNHTIQLGNAENLDDKLARLLAFYQQGMNTINWNNFDEIDARFSGQIVCRNSDGDSILQRNKIEQSKIKERKPIVLPTTKRVQQIVTTAVKSAEHTKVTSNHQSILKAKPTHSNSNYTKENSKAKKAITNSKIIPTQHTIKVKASSSTQIKQHSN